MAFAYLIDPENQFMTKSGTINVDGFLRVFDAATDDPAVTYKDFTGTENPERITLDNNGRAVVIADSEKAYRLEVYDRYGTLMWTTTPLWCQASGGGVAGTEVISSDGSVSIDKITVGSMTTFDLSTHVGDSTDLLGWVRCDGGVQVPETDVWKPTYTAGTLPVGEKGIQLSADQYYHATARVRINKGAAADYYDDMQLVFGLDDGTDITAVATERIIADSSIGLSQDFEISCDVLAESDCELVLEVKGKEIQSLGIEILGVDVHRVYSGAPYIPGGVADKPWVEENYQEKLVPGDGIDITNNVVSAKVDGTTIGVNASGELETLVDNDSAYLAHYGVTTYAEISDAVAAGKAVVLTDMPLATTAILTMSSFSTNPAQVIFGTLIGADEYTATLASDTWSYNSVSIQADWSETNQLRASYIANKPVNLVQDASYVHTDNNFSNADVTKLSGIQAGAEVNVQANWNESDSASDSFIQNKPTIPSGSQLVPSATPSDAGEVLTVDQNGDPTWAPAQAPISAGNGVDITNNVVSAKVDGTSVTFNADGELEATAAPQVQSNWTESDPTDVSFIQNKPGQTSLVAGANITIVDDAQNNTVTISASASQAPVQDVTVDNVSVVNAQGVAEIPSIPVIGTITL